MATDYSIQQEENDDICFLSVVFGSVSVIYLAATFILDPTSLTTFLWTSLAGLFGSSVSVLDGGSSLITIWTIQAFVLFVCRILGLLSGPGFLFSLLATITINLLAFLGMAIGCGD